MIRRVVIGRPFTTRPRRRAHAVFAAAVALIVVIAAVVAVKLAAGSPADGPPGPRTRTATLGLMAPLSADLAPVGTAVRNAVRLAVDEANSQGTIPGWKIRMSVQDDLSRPDGGAQAAGALAADRSVIGVVGPLSSTVAMIALPTLDAAGIAVVSPSNSRPELTGAASSTPSTPSTPRTRPYRTYFRLSGTDVLAARYAAEYAVRVMGRSRIAVVDGGPDFGTSLAERFAAEASRLGATVTGTHRVDGSADDGSEVEQVARHLRTEAPDLVYVATGYAFAAKLRNELAEHGPAVSVLGSDGLFDPHYPGRTQSASEGDLVTDLAAPLSELPQAREFAAAYLDRWSDEDGSDSNRGDDARSSEPGHGATAGRNSPAGGPTGSPTRGGSPIGGPASGGGPTGDGANSGGPGSGARTGAGAGAGGSNGGNAPDRAASGADSPAGGGGHVVVSASPAVSPSPDVDVIPPVAAYAYDAARALLRAAGSVLPGRDDVDEATRAAIVTAVGQGRFPGATGDVGFDAWGDPLTPVVTVYAVRNRTFVPVRVHRSAPS